MHLPVHEPPRATFHFRHRLMVPHADRILLENNNRHVIGHDYESVRYDAGPVDFTVHFLQLSDDGKKTKVFADRKGWIFFAEEIDHLIETGVIAHPDI